jgi:hypothetical protein
MCFDCQCRLGGLEPRPPVQLVRSTFLCFLQLAHYLNNVDSGSVSGYSAGMAVRGSVGLAHAGKRKKSVVQLRSEAKSRNRAWPQLWVPVAPMHFPGAGKNALSYACMRHTSSVSRFAHRALRKSAERPSEGGFEGIEKVFAAIGLGGAAQPARRGMLSQDLFESPNGSQSRRSSAANGHGNGQEGITPPPEALVHEKSMAEGEKKAPLKDLPYPFPGFGLRDSSKQEQIPFPPSPAVPEESAGGHDDDEEEREGDIVVEVEDDEGEEEEEEEGNINPRSSEEPSSFSGHASNSLSSLGQPIRSHFVTWLEGAACHPQACLLSPSRVPLRHHKARALQPANRTRRVARAMWRR